MKKFNIKGVKIDTWARLIVLLLAFVSQLLVIIGKRTKAIDVETWQEYATYIATAITAAWGYWKNNSFTNAAQYGDKVKDKINEFDDNPNGDNSSPFDDLKIEESEVDIDVP